MNEEHISELKPVYDKDFTSYHGQAFILQKDKEKILLSFNQKVATIKENHVKVIMCKTHGQERHIREFLKQNHFEVGSNKHFLLERYGK